MSRSFRARSLGLAVAAGAVLALSASLAALAADQTVAMTDANTFAPSKVTVSVGDTVTWTNPSGSPHTVTADNGSFDSGITADPFQHTFQTAGTYDYICELHPDTMKGTVEVTAAGGNNGGNPGGGNPGGGGDPEPPDTATDGGQSSIANTAIVIAAVTLLLGALLAVALVRRRASAER